MAEEWPDLHELMEENPGFSVCILAPYRGQLVGLQERTRQALAQEKTTVEPADVRVTAPSTRARADEEEMLALTIHKAQGEEFDAVYVLLLPMTVYGSGPGPRSAVW